MRIHIALVLAAGLAGAAHAENAHAETPPCAARAAVQDGVLMTFASAPARPEGFRGRGELSSWSPLAGSWEGAGTDATGALTVKAGLESLYDGRYVLLRTTESRDGHRLREQLLVWVGGETSGAFLYDADAPFRRLAGGVDASGTALSAGDAKLRVTWKQGPDGLTGVREEADASGALVETGRWTLKRGAARSLIERGTCPVGPLSGLVGKHKGQGETAVTLGSGVGAHFFGEDEGVSALSSAIVVTHETHTYKDHTDQALLVHGLENDHPFRHVFSSKGVMQQLSGDVVDRSRLVFAAPVPEGTLKVTFVPT